MPSSSKSPRAPLAAGRRRSHVLLVVWLAVPCGTAGAQAPRPSASQRVLFVGNSLTYVNDLPRVVASVAASAGIEIDVGMAADPNLALIDHINGASDAIAQIRSGHWDRVLLQQGPTTIEGCRDSLLLWAETISTTIRAAGAEPALLMTWPTQSAPERFDAVRVSFQAAAAAVDGLFLPAGDAWRLALADDSATPVYGGDGFHPSATGTYLMALEIVERLTGKDPRALPTAGSGIPAGLAPATVRRLQAAAHDANVRWPARTPLASVQGYGPGPHPAPPGGRC